MEQNIDQSFPVPCDVCGADDPEEIPCTKKYTEGQPLHVCRKCGFVYVTNRRSSERIAEAWSTEIYKETQADSKLAVTYTARSPAVMSRLTFVAETVSSVLKFNSGRLCDIGAGEGVFLELMRNREPGVELFGVEPSLENCKAMQQMGIACEVGTIEDFIVSSAGENFKDSFDLITILWTLENCFSCRDMIEAASRLLKPDGTILIATGSRLLVPFKKPLQYYLGKNPMDTHSFRFSSKSLSRLMAQYEFFVTHENRYIDNDVLLKCFSRNGQISQDEEIPFDNYLDVLDFFHRWDVDSQFY
jgi:2-polyprenyl-3-methyl-5-hydroxy-6-metoxy-1,4-benzoquinol methylase